MGSRDAQEGLPGAALWAPDTGQDYKGDPERSSVKIPWSLEGVALPMFRSAGPLSLERAGRRLPPQECTDTSPLCHSAWREEAVGILSAAAASQVLDWVTDDDVRVSRRPVRRERPLSPPLWLRCVTRGSSVPVLLRSCPMCPGPHFTSFRGRPPRWPLLEGS